MADLSQYSDADLRTELEQRQLRDGPTPRQQELHRQLLAWYLWRTEGIGEPSPLPEASLEELLGAQRVMGDWHPPHPSGRGRCQHFTIDESALALEWGAAKRAGCEDRCRAEAVTGSDFVLDDVVYVTVGHATEPGPCVVLDAGRQRFVLRPDEARDLGWAVLAARASLLAETSEGGDRG